MILDFFGYRFVSIFVNSKKANLQKNESRTAEGYASVNNSFELNAKVYRSAVELYAIF